MTKIPKYKDGSVAAVSICDSACLDHDAANEAPPPAQGFFDVDGALFYVSERGATWLVRDTECVVQLVPCDLPADANEIEEVLDSDVLALAEAADGLGFAPGVYKHGEHFYCRTDDQSFLLYGTDLFAVALASLPPHATLLDEVPDRVMAAVSRVLEAS